MPWFDVGGFSASTCPKVTFRDGTVSLKQAFEKIEASSKYKIAYNDSHLNVSRKVSLNQKETEVLEILATILKDTGYTYKRTVTTL